jgi:magnesium chelatase family protein
MLARVHSAALAGVDGFPVRVEVNVSSGLPSFAVVGLPEGVVREGRERVLTGLANAGYPIPPRRITVNLAPADVRKDGSALDLPIAVGLLAATDVVPPHAVEGLGFYGELGLDGRLKAVRGTLAAVATMRDGGLSGVILPGAAAAEGALVRGMRVRGAESITDVVGHLTGRSPLPLEEPEEAWELAESVWPQGRSRVMDSIRGQPGALRALEISAAGGHNLLMVGPPGTGKTLLARGLAEILPAMSRSEALEVTRVRSASGLPMPPGGVVWERPFRAPHHTVSHAGLLGGGPALGPGEATLAHRGVLFLDELPEFSRRVLEALRQPLEDGWIRLARARGRVTLPARFVLVAAMNPCPCGYGGSDGSGQACRCDPVRIARYRSRVSGPLMDRIDLQVHVRPVSPADLFMPIGPGPDIAERARRVDGARTLQRRRYGDLDGVECNADLQGGLLDERIGMGPDARESLTAAATALGFSARACHRIMRVARTISDLDGEERVSEPAVLEAAQYRKSPLFS